MLPLSNELSPKIIEKADDIFIYRSFGKNEPQKSALTNKKVFMVIFNRMDSALLKTVQVHLD